MGIRHLKFVLCPNGSCGDSQTSFNGIRSNYSKFSALEGSLVSVLGLGKTRSHIFVFWVFEAPLHLLKPEEKADYLPVAVNFYPKY